MPRTGSIASNVGPAVSSTRLPASTFGCARRDDRGEELLRLRACGRRRFSLHASSPVSGPEDRRRRRRRAARRCAAWRRSPTSARFIAGATSSGHSRARQSVDSRSSARPCASLARKSADAGATTMASAPRDSVDVAHRVVGAGVPQVGQRPVVRTAPGTSIGVTKRVAASVITTSTAMPCLDEQARELRGLVRGDAAGDAEHHAFKARTCRCGLRRSWTVSPDKLMFPWTKEVYTARRRRRRAGAGRAAEPIRIIQGIERCFLLKTNLVGQPTGLNSFLYTRGVQGNHRNRRKRIAAGEDRGPSNTRAV